MMLTFNFRIRITGCFCLSFTIIPALPNAVAGSVLTETLSGQEMVCVVSVTGIIVNGSRRTGTAQGRVDGESVRKAAFLCDISPVAQEVFWRKSCSCGPVVCLCGRWRLSLMMLFSVPGGFLNSTFSIHPMKLYYRHRAELQTTVCRCEFVIGVTGLGYWARSFPLCLDNYKHVLSFCCVSQINPDSSRQTVAADGD